MNKLNSLFTLLLLNIAIIISGLTISLIQATTFAGTFIGALLFLLSGIIGFLFYIKYRKTIETIEKKIIDIEHNYEKGTISNNFPELQNIEKINNLLNNFTKKIVEKESWYIAMLDAIPFPISVTDMNMNWTFFNKPAIDIMGKKREDFIGKQCNNWSADICKTEKCGIEMLRKGKYTSYFTQPGIDMDFQVDSVYNTSVIFKRQFCHNSRVL